LKVELSLLVQRGGTGPLRWTLEDLRTGTRQRFATGDELLSRLQEGLRETETGQQAPDREGRPGPDLNPA
jgi:hypothetical protein